MWRGYKTRLQIKKLQLLVIGSRPAGGHGAERLEASEGGGGGDEQDISPSKPVNYMEGGGGSDEQAVSRPLATGVRKERSERRRMRRTCSRPKIDVVETGTGGANSNLASPASPHGESHWEESTRRV